jgi:GAF domain-containing protein
VQVGCTFSAGALLEAFIQEVSNVTSVTGKVVRLVGGAFVIAVAVALERLISGAARQAREESESLDEALSYAHSVADQLVTDEVRLFEQAPLLHHGDCKSCVDRSIDRSRRRIDSLIRGLYQLFEARFAESRRATERIDFEVTFMARSYRDQGITIPFHSNRRGRRPQSMDERQNNPKIYETTITAELYRSDNPQMRIIEDTNAGEEYKELYPSQKKRILSSVVFPVRSARNELLGTLVVHCNRKGFFRASSARFLEELLEIFAQRIAFEKLTLDQLHTLPVTKESPTF